MRGYHIWLMAG